MAELVSSPDPAESSCSSSSHEDWSEESLSESSAYEEEDDSPSDDAIIAMGMEPYMHEPVVSDSDSGAVEEESRADERLRDTSW